MDYQGRTHDMDNNEILVLKIKADQLQFCEKISDEDFELVMDVRYKIDECDSISPEDIKKVSDMYEEHFYKPFLGSKKDLK